MSETDELTAEHGQVPADLLELFEVLEYDRLSKEQTRRGTPSVEGLLTAPDNRVISRAVWGAKNPGSVSTNITPAKGGVAWHYEGPHMGLFPHASCATKVRGIQAFHMGPSRGWADIAYTCIYCPHGYIYQGRWWGHRTAAQGTNDGNQRYYAACFLGGVDDPFTIEGREAASLFRRLATQDGGAGPDNKPHSHFHATGCPGESIRNWLATGMSSPTPAPVPNETGDEEVSQFATAPIANGGIYIYNGQTKFPLGSMAELTTAFNNGHGSKTPQGNYDVKVYDSDFFARVPDITKMGKSSPVTFDVEVQEIAKAAVQELADALNAGLK